MRTTVVVRGGEWLASAPIHYELFHVLGFKMPKYAHTAHLMKFDEETGGKRKLSKRKDPELSLDYYRKDGYHPYTMKVYLMTLLNSNFEEWHEKFPDKDINEFPFSLDKMSTSGALFDKDKLHNICKNELSKLSEDELYDFLYDWAEENEPEKKNIWFADKEKMLGILRLYMGIGMKRRRKDFMYAKQIFEMIGYFFDMEDTQEKDEFRMDMEDVKTILNEYLSMYNHEDDNSEWFNKLKAIADKHGYASDMKAYKANPEAFKGNVSDIAEVIRIAVTGKANTPDLWSIVHVMGEAQMRDKIHGKADICEHYPVKFFIRAIMAGFFIVVATILSNVSAAVLYSTYPQFGKLLGAFLFSIAIVLIVFIGGELFTGNNMTMAMGAYAGTCTWKQVLKVWLVSYIGNFVGAFFLSFLFVKSGASHQILVDYYNSFLAAKLSAPPMQLFLRGVLCNFCVCLAVLTGTRMKSESGKLIVMFCVIMAFVVSGFEHCVANMGTFSIAYLLFGSINPVLLAKSMICVTLGNIVGGALLLAAPLKLMSAEK